MNKSIILLSGGLDSLVCLGLCKQSHNIELALTFDYGQKSAEQEIATSKKLAEYYNVNHKVIELPFLKEITHTALIAGNIQTDNLFTPDSAKNVWVPNRNGLFLNIAGAFADSDEYTHIILGANKEEAKTFPDNSKEFVDSAQELFKYSTLVKPNVYTPLINYDKDGIVALALEHNMPLELTRSCYNKSEKNCGVCESCAHLKNALKNNNAEELIKVLFEDAN